MHLHVLTGYPEFLRPAILPREEIGGLIGEDIRAVTAYWLTPKCGDQYHDFLQEEPDDIRTTVIADAMRDDFGARFEPLLVLTDLLTDDASSNGDDRRSQMSVLSEILGSDHFDQVTLYGFAFPEDADPDGCWAAQLEVSSGQAGKRLERICAALTEAPGPESITYQIREVLPEMNGFSTLYNNAVSNALTRRLESQFEAAGWQTANDELTNAVFGLLAQWNDSGLYVGQPLSKDHFGSLADTLYGQLLRT